MTTIGQKYQKLLELIEKVTLPLTCLVLALLFCNESLGILSDWMGYSIPWITEVSVILFSWVIFIGAGVITRTNSHISLDVLIERLSPRGRHCLKIAHVFLMLIVAFVMIYFGGKHAMFVGQYQKTVYLKISLFYLYFSVPVGGVLLGLNALGQVFKAPDAREPSKIEKIEENPLY
jgi:TRAP-type C4-dicarboxylate transport system permease small subunit